MLYLRPSSEVERVRPVMACLETVYAAESGVGGCRCYALGQYRDWRGECTRGSGWLERYTSIEVNGKARLTGPWGGGGD